MASWSEIVVISDGTEVCFNLLCFLCGLQWWEVYYEPHGLSGYVLGGSEYDSHCLVLHSVQLYQICLYHCCEA